MDDPKEVEAIEEESPYPVLKRNPNSWRGKCGVDWRADFAQPWFQVNDPLQSDLNLPSFSNVQIVATKRVWSLKLIFIE